MTPAFWGSEPVTADSGKYAGTRRSAWPKCAPIWRTRTSAGWRDGCGQRVLLPLHSPVILIEFNHQTPVALPGPREPGRRHIHSVVRTPNGSDYGKDLLRQHYLAHQHDAMHGHVQAPWLACALAAAGSSRVHLQLVVHA